MGKFICQFCGKEYESGKKNSKYCSIECRKNAGSVTHKCDYCGNQYRVKMSTYRRYISGEIKNLCCSRECASLIQHTKVELTCGYCGKPFMMFNCFKNVQKYCSRECYNNHRRENGKLKTIECPICHKAFRQTYVKQQYCSRECRGISEQKRATLICDVCGKTFDRKLSDLHSTTSRYYCSATCRNAALYWSLEDRQTLFDHYSDTSSEEMVILLGNKYTLSQIKSRADYYGLNKGSEFWTLEEENILKENYPNKPFQIVQSLLPKRSYSAILGKARLLGLSSYYYKTNKYLSEEIKYIQDNYPQKSISEIAGNLNRSEAGIRQKIRLLGINEPYAIKKTAYPDLAKFMRSRLTVWSNNIRKENNYTCCITGSHSNIVVHHCRGFNLLFDEVIEMIGLPIYDNVSDYTDEQLEEFVEAFLYLQESYGAYVCITEDVHKAFHSKYGYGYNTEKQWEEFKQSYKNN